MKLKSFVLLFVLLLLTGCSVEYNLRFEDDVIKEKIYIKDDFSIENQRMFDMDYYAIINASTSKAYNKSIIDDRYELSYDYGFNEFRNSRFLNCYDAYSINNDDDVITFSTSKQFKCMIYDYMIIDDVVVSISTDYDVINSNADVVEGNVYKWNINNDNYLNKPIKFSYKKKSQKSNVIDFWKKNKDLFVILLSCGVFMLMISLFIIIKNKRVNKI